MADDFVRFRTPFGDMTVQVFSTDKPITSANFLRYVREGRYQDMISHRVVPSFIVQGGGFGITNRNSPGVGFADIPDFGLITNEFNVGPRLSNVYGTIAMAKLPGNPNSASSEWFFNLANNGANLDAQNGGFTVFGRVVAGTNVLNVFRTFTSTVTVESQPTNRLINISGSFSAFDSRPQPAAFPQLRMPPNFSGIFTNLVFIEITELPVVARLEWGSPQSTLTWTSVPGVTNRVEVAASPGGPWTNITQVVPTDLEVAVPVVTDSSAAQFFRVQIVP